MIPGGRWLGIRLFESLLLGQLGASDAPIPVRVELDAPAGCPEAQAFYHAVRQRTDRVREATPGETATLLRVRLTRTGSSVFGELNLTGERGESDRRAVRGVSCSEVVEALSLTAALALDPEALTTTTTLPPPPPAPTPPPTPPPEPCPPPPEPSDEGGSFNAGVAARFVATSVIEPEWSGGGAFAIRLEPVDIAPFFEVGVLHVDNAVFGSPARKRASLSAFTFTGCAARFELTTSFGFSPCALGIAGFLDATGRNVTTPETVVRSYVSLGTELGFDATFDSFAVDAAGALNFPLFRRRFVSGTPETSAGETPTVSPLFSLGLRYNW